MIKNCNKCKRIINQKSVTAQGYSFHPECFNCAECKKKITNSFNSKGADFYHTECYQKKFRLFCSKCRKPFEDKWVVSNGLKYHEECYQNFIQLKCNICSKPIEGTYNHDEHGNYHVECYKSEKAAKCDICSQIIEGEYFIDNWGNKSHKKHDGVAPSFCDSCSRVISPATSKGATKYNDGRKICGICQETEIIEVHQTVPAKIRVVEALNKVGFAYIPGMINVSLVDKITMNKMMGNSITTNTHGCTKTVIKNENGKVKKEYSITMLYGLPQLQFDGVLAHELLHVWLHENNVDVPDDMTEGFCNLACALIYQNDKTKFADVLLKQLEQDTDKVYGDGYRAMSKKLKETGWTEVMNSLVNYKPQLIKEKVTNNLTSKTKEPLKRPEPSIKAKEPPSNPYLEWKRRQQEKK